MYGSYYIIHIDTGISPTPLVPMVHYKVEANQFIDVENAAHFITEFLNETMDSEWVLRSIEKHYAYSHDEFVQMHGLTDFRLKFNESLKEDDDVVVTAIIKPFVAAMDKAGML